MLWILPLLFLTASAFKRKCEPVKEQLYPSSLNVKFSIRFEGTLRDGIGAPPGMVDNHMIYMWDRPKPFGRGLVVGPNDHHPREKVRANAVLDFTLVDGRLTLVLGSDDKPEIWEAVTGGDHDRLDNTTEFYMATYPHIPDEGRLLFGLYYTCHLKTNKPHYELRPKSRANVERGKLIVRPTMDYVEFRWEPEGTRRKFQLRVSDGSGSY